MLRPLGGASSLNHQTAKSHSEFAPSAPPAPLAVLIRKFDFELISPLPVPNYEAMVVGPKGETRVRYKRRAL